jgi:hypothetical protein
LPASNKGLKALLVPVREAHLPSLINNFVQLQLYILAVAQLVEALRYEPGGREFDS